MQKWEYQFVVVSKTHAGFWRVSLVNEQDIFPQPSLHDYSNQVGNDGWELISDNVSSTEREMVFKRPRQ